MEPSFFMNRRHFFRAAGLSSAAASILTSSQVNRASAAPAAPGWRTFEITTRVEVLRTPGSTRIWLPTPLPVRTPYQQTLANEFHPEPGGRARLIETGGYGLGIIAAEFPSGVNPVLTHTARVTTRDHAVDLTAPQPRTSRADLEQFLRPTRLLPTDGIVKTTAAEITAGAKTDLEKARAIYEWMVDNTSRNPKTQGCGLGDIRFMLESRDLGGKCADLNALFVGLARAAGLPARDVYGIRVAKSELGYKSLGASSATITKSQHCRAEVHLDGFGWVPADPADVRKVVLEEPPGNRSLQDEMVTKARARLFGSWEMNWIGYNFAHDVALPGASTAAPLGFLMYPQAETGSGRRIDCYDPDNFKYEITAKEV